jgi:2-oxoglutarate dehydrogenase E1 component
LDFQHHGFSEADLDRKLSLDISNTANVAGFLRSFAEAKEGVTLRQVLDKLEATYTSTLGVEYLHMSSTRKCDWVRSRVEKDNLLSFSAEKKIRCFERLAEASMFENYLNTKFNTTKRFGLDGGEAMVAGLNAIVDMANKEGISSIVLGMAHRGRLNVLANVMHKSMVTIFREFQGTHYDLEEYMRDSWSSSGDVKYHLGTTSTKEFEDGTSVELSLVANPSHLEAVNPVVAGKARAKQFLQSDRARRIRSKDLPEFDTTLPLLIHGDASFAGQGIIYELMNMSNVQDFDVGGTIHVICNNQVGFTTNPTSSRSTLYCTDIAKAFDIPVFHCNGDDPVAVVRAFELAVEWRQLFNEDVVVDFVCYRRNGHNELDQPLFTQPELYSAISSQPTTLEIFERRLIEEGTATQEQLDAIKQRIHDGLDSQFAQSKSQEEIESHMNLSQEDQEKEWLGSNWKGFKSKAQLARIKETGVDRDTFRSIGERVTTIPTASEDGGEFKPHPLVARIYKQRNASITSGENIDWATAEMMAFATLLTEGNMVRLTGQDVERGTFSHRHAVIHNQTFTNDRMKEYIPLNDLREENSPHACLLQSDDQGSISENLQAPFTVRNSILSEFAVLGFELGYSLENPNSLVLWEAQFGDFANGAQIMIDNFIMPGESKWIRQSGLVMLLPHGYDGQGAEHSSCRIERFLQLIDESEDDFQEFGHGSSEKESDLNFEQVIQQRNAQVVNCTTPAQYFHVLRRQVHREFRKPLIVVAPKNMLRHKQVMSTIEDFESGTRFRRVIGDETLSEEEVAKVTKVVFCSGKVYYDLLEERERLRKEQAEGEGSDNDGFQNVALIRVEQVAPFPFDSIKRELCKFDPSTTRLVWCQEEPRNQGCYSFMHPRLRSLEKHCQESIFSNGGVKESREVEYVGRRACASSATGLGVRAHQAELSDMFRQVFFE